MLCSLRWILQNWISPVIQQKMDVYTLNSFAKTKEGGNPAGVVMNADSLSEEEMRKIAAVLGFSETAFVLQSNAADFKVRFFTPNEEVDLCGHATIATFYAMSSLNLLKQGKYEQETTEVITPLGKIVFSEAYGIVKDPFGVLIQLTYDKRLAK